MPLVVSLWHKRAGVSKMLSISELKWSCLIIRERLVQAIKENNGRLLSQFRILRTSVEVVGLLKNCRSEGCRAADCEFSLTQLRFFCLCSAWTENKAGSSKPQIRAQYTQACVLIGID